MTTLTIGSLVEVGSLPVGARVAMHCDAFAFCSHGGTAEVTATGKGAVAFRVASTCELGGCGVGFPFTLGPDSPRRLLSLPSTPESEGARCHVGESIPSEHCPKAGVVQMRVAGSTLAPAWFCEEHVRRYEGPRSWARVTPAHAECVVLNGVEFRVGDRVVAENFQDEQMVGCVHPDEKRFFLSDYSHGGVATIRGALCEKHGTNWFVAAEYAPRHAEPEAATPEVKLPTFDAKRHEADPPASSTPETPADRLARIRRWNGCDDYPELPSAEEVEEARKERAKARRERKRLSGASAAQSDLYDFSRSTAEIGVRIPRPPAVPLDSRIAACGGSTDPEPERRGIRDHARARGSR